MRTSIATVCLSGSLSEKLHACASAGFDGIEIMDSDLVAAFESPEEIRALCERLGLSIDMFQPLRDIEGVDDAIFSENLRRAEAKFQLMVRLGTDLILLCSNVGTATNGDTALMARQLGELADVAARYGIRIAYEALAWGRFISDYRDAWNLVRIADRPNLGVCLDSFHVLSRGHDPAAIERIDPGKLFFLQLADAPELQLDVLSWSRHHRLFPGEGDFDLVRFLGHVLRAGYTGPLSLEVFNDTFRQTDVVRTARHARRSLSWLADRAAAENGWADGLLDPPQPPTGIDFIEIAGSDLSEVEQILSQLGFAFGGGHRSKAVRLWRAGETRVILNEQGRDPGSRLSGIGLLVSDAHGAERRAKGLGSPSLFRRAAGDEQELGAVSSPDGTDVFWADTAISEAWQNEFEGGHENIPFEGRVDHINITTPWQDHDEAVLFNTSVLALESQPTAEVPGPLGLIRSQVMRTPGGAVRLAMNLVPPTAPLLPRHLAVRVDDAITVAQRARDRGLVFLPIPGNYYDDLAARFNLEPSFTDILRDLGLLYDRDSEGAFIHFYTPTVDHVFFEILQRVGPYDGYGAPNAPVRLAAQRTYDQS